MGTRKDALAWLNRNGAIVDGEIFTSKFYIPSQSWTGKNAWWIQIPLKRLQPKQGLLIHILCQSSPGSSEFHYLKIPADYLLENLHGMALMGEKMINLFLSAEPENLFQDERGNGRIWFNQFFKNGDQMK